MLPNLMFPAILPMLPFLGEIYSHIESSIGFWQIWHNTTLLLRPNFAAVSTIKLSTSATHYVIFSVPAGKHMVSRLTLSRATNLATRYMVADRTNKRWQDWKRLRLDQTCLNDHISQTSVFGSDSIISVWFCSLVVDADDGSPIPRARIFSMP